MPFRCFSDWLLWDVTANISCLSVLSGAAEIKTSPECPRVAKDCFFKVLIPTIENIWIYWWMETRLIWRHYDVIYVTLWPRTFPTKNVNVADKSAMFTLPLFIVLTITTCDYFLLHWYYIQLVKEVLKIFQNQWKLLEAFTPSKKHRCNLAGVSSLKCFEMNLKFWYKKIYNF